MQFCSAEADELMLYRREGKRLGWLYIGSNRVGWVFTAFSVVANAKPMKRKEVQAYLRKEYDKCI